MVTGRVVHNVSIMSFIVQHVMQKTRKLNLETHIPFIDFERHLIELTDKFFGKFHTQEYPSHLLNAPVAYMIIPR